MWIREESVLSVVSEKMKETSCRDDIALGVVAEDNEVLFIMWIGSLVTAAVLIKRNENVSLVVLADSTGFKRGHNKEFISAVVSSLSGFVVCFSYPKEELIFGKSSLNGLKKAMKPKELYMFWKSCFKGRCPKCKDLGLSREAICNYQSLSSLNEHLCYFSGWSNFECTGAFPYTSLKELKRFKDDPKTKMRGKFRNISDLFNGLLFRKDFVEGGLLFSNCRCSDNASMLAGKYQKNRLKRQGEIDKVVEFLRNSDFSDENKAWSASKMLEQTFKIKRVVVVPSGNEMGRCPAFDKDGDGVKAVKPREVR